MRYLGIIVGTFICKRGIGWCHLGNMREGRGGFTLGLGVDGSEGGLRKGLQGFLSRSFQIGKLYEKL